jgi:nucleotide-binding universal stress UspA family protein
VLVGIDGSAESETALRTAIEILGPRTGRLTIAGVTGFDYGSSQAQADTKRALESLRAMAASASVSEAGIIILSGRPADALTEFALRDGYELLVVGRRGRGASKAILGSTAAQLASASTPVLVAA